MEIDRISNGIHLEIELIEDKIHWESSESTGSAIGMIPDDW